MSEKWQDIIVDLQGKYPPLKKRLHDFMFRNEALDDRLRVAGEDPDKIATAKKENREEFSNMLAWETSPEEADEFIEAFDRAHAEKRSV